MSARHRAWVAGATVSVLNLLASGPKYHSARDFDGVVCETFVVASEQCHVDRGGDAMLPILIHQHCE